MPLKPFLSARWRNLVMANYHVDPRCLKKYVPAGTELDTFNENHYVSLVGFLFINTRVQGFSFPLHRTFEEVNLRFYVRFKEDGKWKRGVVFIKEIVPKRMISFIANSLYNEKYVTHQMKHTWIQKEDGLHVAYYWKVNGLWNYLKVKGNPVSRPVREGSEEEFITEHYWGYTTINNFSSGEYEVKHPRWNVHTVSEYDIECSTSTLYGSEFAEALAAKPSSVFLADGSAIEVMKGRKINNTSF